MPLLLGLQYRSAFAVTLLLCSSLLLNNPCLTTTEALLFSSNKSRMQNLLTSRRTTNDFKKKLPRNWEKAVVTAVEAAMSAPNHKRTEPWRFHLLGPESIRKVCQLNSHLVTVEKGHAAGKQKLNRWTDIPGWLVVTCQRDPQQTMLQPTSMAREDYAACCCAIQNLCLSLHAQGFGTKWTTGPVNFHPAFDRAVGLDSTKEYVVGTVWFGKPAKRPKAPPKKLKLSDVLILHK